MSLKDMLYMNITTVCLETPSSKNLFHIEIRQLICIASKMAVFYMIRVLTERYF